MMGVTVLVAFLGGISLSGYVQVGERKWFSLCQRIEYPTPEKITGVPGCLEVSVVPEQSNPLNEYNPLHEYKLDTWSTPLSKALDE